MPNRLPTGGKEGRQTDQLRPKMAISRKKHGEIFARNKIIATFALAFLSKAMPHGGIAQLVRAHDS